MRTVGTSPGAFSLEFVALELELFDGITLRNRRPGLLLLVTAFDTTSSALSSLGFLRPTAFESSVALLSSKRPLLLEEVGCVPGEPLTSECYKQKTHTEKQGAPSGPQ